MKLSTFCIQRPVFATVLSLILVMIGIMGYQHLETRFFPRFAPHKIIISTIYPGASAQLVESSVTTPLEKAITGLDGIDHISSDSSQGMSAITVVLNSGANIYNVTNKIRNQIAMASGSLPNTIQSPVVRTGYSGMDLMDIGFTITNEPLSNLRDYVDRYVVNQIQELPGISSVAVLGANKYAMRITLHPNKMAARQITPNNISTAIANNNLQLPAGSIHSPSMDFPITAKTALHTVDQFKNIVVKNVKGQLIYLKDVATVKLGPNTESKSFVRINGTPGVLLTVYNADDANPITASTEIRTLLKTISAQLPSNIHYSITFDQSTFMKSSISEVYKTIGIAIAFVAMIIFLSLGTIRSSFIPIITIPICILSTMGFMYFAGFSINIITLLAIVLSIGLVVDDAIVVLENIHRHIEQGLSRIDAAMKGSQEIATPVIAMTLTLAAVYAPIGLIKGMVAHIFASFAFTLAIAVIVSGFVALTLSPMMCSKLLTDNHASNNRLHDRIQHFFNRLTETYQRLLSVVLMHRLKITIVTIVLAIGGFMLASTLQKTFLPKEDMGFLITLLKSSSGANNNYSQNQLKIINQLLLKNSSTNKNVSLSFDPVTNHSNNLIFSTLKDYGQRDKTADQVASEMNNAYQKIPGLGAISFAPSFGGDVHSEVAFYIMAPTRYQTLYDVGNTLVRKLGDYRGLNNLNSNIQYNDQQYNLTVDRALADAMQVNVSNIDNTLASLLGGSTVSTFSVGGQTYDVDMQAAKPYLQSVQAIQAISVPNASGQLVPLKNLVTFTPTPTQADLFHYDRLRAAKITGEIAPGYSLGQVVNYLQSALPTILPSEVKYTFTGQAEQVVKSSNAMWSVFLLAFVFIYLVLSAQFESFLDPLIILLAVPLSIIGALVSLKCFHGSINLYTMIGLITLVGLISKHGILITQFANTLQKSGENWHDALIHAASIRLRPILMTTAAMMFGALPLVLATGASAVGREQVGVVLVSGLLFGTFFSLILVPISYSYFNQLKLFVMSRCI